MFDFWLFFKVQNYTAPNYGKKSRDIYWSINFTHSVHHSSYSHSMQQPLRLGEICRPSLRHRPHFGMRPFGRPEWALPRPSVFWCSTVAVGVSIGVCRLSAILSSWKAMFSRIASRVMTQPQSSPIWSRCTKHRSSLGESNTHLSQSSMSCSRLLIICHSIHIQSSPSNPPKGTHRMQVHHDRGWWVAKCEASFHVNSKQWVQTSAFLINNHSRILLDLRVQVACSSNIHTHAIARSPSIGCILATNIHILFLFRHCAIDVRFDMSSFNTPTNSAWR